MRATIDAKTLQQALKIARIITPRKPAIPQAGLMRLTAADNVMTLSVTNCRTQLDLHLPAQVLRPGQAVIFAENLLRMKFPALSASTEFVAFDDALEILTTSAHISLPLHDDPNDFPPLPSTDCRKVAQMDNIELHHAIRLTAFAASKDPQDDVIYKGLHFARTQYAIEVVATDRYRLAIYRLRNYDAEHEFKFTIPPEAAQTLKDIVANAPRPLGPHPLELYANDDNSVVVFECPIFSLTTSTIAEQFPRYERLLTPSQIDFSCRCDARELLKCLKTIKPYAQPETRICPPVVTLTYDPASHTLEISHKSLRTYLDVDSDSDQPHEFRLRFPYLLDFAQACNDARVFIARSNSIIYFQPLSKPEPLYLVAIVKD